MPPTKTLALPESSMLLPGEAHPHPSLSVDDLAHHLGVTTTVVDGWVKKGLPVDFGTIDPFTANNWITRNALWQVPALERRWKRLLAWLRPFAKGQDQPWKVRVRRAQRVHLDAADTARLTAVRWWVPRLPDWAGQTMEADLLPGAEQRGAHWMLDTEHVLIAGTAQVDLRPVTGHLPEFLPLVEDLVMESHYGYRHHLPEDTAEPREERSCLDLAVLLGQRISEKGRPWRLCAGVFAFDEVANPHFWIEVETTEGWSVIDPTPPAICRQFSSGDDWRDWAKAWCGGCDARRVTAARGEAPVRDVPGGPTMGSVAGEVAVCFGGTKWVNAWACTDWACGSCNWTFRTG